MIDSAGNIKMATPGAPHGGIWKSDTFFGKNCPFLRCLLSLQIHPRVISVPFLRGLSTTARGCPTIPPGPHTQQAHKPWDSSFLTPFLSFSTPETNSCPARYSQPYNQTSLSMQTRPEQDELPGMSTFPHMLGEKLSYQKRIQGFVRCRWLTALSFQFRICSFNRPRPESIQQRNSNPTNFFMLCRQVRENQIN